MAFVKENYDVVVVGAGHAGCEAALACARLGLETILFTISVDSIATVSYTHLDVYKRQVFPCALSPYKILVPLSN